MISFGAPSEFFRVLYRKKDCGGDPAVGSLGATCVLEQ
jgi:hypothetical protein